MIEVKDVKCDIYVGRAAGEELHTVIRKAKKSVRIVSPYLSPSLVAELIALHKREIEVELVT